MAAIAGVGWLLLAGGLEVVREDWNAAWPLALPGRRLLLFACAFIYFLRVVLTTFYLLKRKMGWGEAVLISLWLAIVHLLFAGLGGINPKPLGWAAGAGALLYMLGSMVNTCSELSRKKWKARPENRGHLYTYGLFRYAQHINYFGDEMLFAGYALITGAAWALIVPAIMFASFVFFSIPDLDRHLKKQYGAEFEAYARRTRRFVPFLY